MRSNAYSVPQSFVGVLEITQQPVTGWYLDAQLDLAALQELLPPVQQNIHQAPDLVRYQMNSILISHKRGIGWAGAEKSQDRGKIYQARRGRQRFVDSNKEAHAHQITVLARMGFLRPYET